MISVYMHLICFKASDINGHRRQITEPKRKKRFRSVIFSPLPHPHHQKRSPHQNHAAQKLPPFLVKAPQTTHGKQIKHPHFILQPVIHHKKDHLRHISRIRLTTSASSSAMRILYILTLLTFCRAPQTPADRYIFQEPSG